MCACGLPAAFFRLRPSTGITELQKVILARPEGEMRVGRTVVCRQEARPLTDGPVQGLLVRNSRLTFRAVEYTEMCCQEGRYSSPRSGNRRFDIYLAYRDGTIGLQAGD